MTTPISHRRLLPSTSLWISLALASLILYSNAPAQQLSSVSTNIATATVYSEVSRGPHSRLMQRTTTLTNAAGVAITRTNSYVECGTGMSVLSNGVYVAASPQIQITPFGGAATNCQTPVAFAANLNTSDAIDLTTPDGLHMTSDIAALAYYDGTTSVFFALPQDSIGQLLPSLNQVLYTNAFTNASCDVLYTLTRSGFEQNVIIRQQLPSPVACGLNADNNIWLQVWTEFTAAPTPQISETVSNGDQTLTFGQMSMRRGKAFLLGTNTASVPTVKRWFTSEGRTFLIESVLLNALAPQLNQLPGGSGPTGGSSGGEQSRIRPPHPLLASAVAPRQKPIQLPAKRLAGRKSGTMRLANALPAQKGVVVDYDLSGTVSSFTFQSDTTYFIIDAVNILGAATYEGGTVIKFTNSPTASIAAGSVVWNTSMYRPSIFTGKDDNTVGTTVSGSTGNPTTNFYGNIALDLSEISSPIVSNARFMFLSNVFLGDYITLRDVQAINCDAVFNYQGFSYSLENVLLANDNVVSDANAELEGFSGNSVTCQNVTADNCGVFEVDPTSATLFTNCILTHVGDWRCGVTYTNSSVFLSNSSGIFQTAGAGNYYLADGSTNRNAGTTNIHSALLTDLRQKTTCPPLRLTNNFTANTNIFPQAPRDTNSSPDRGYHYDRIDYLSSCTVSTNVTLTLSNGVAIAYYNQTCVSLLDGARLNSQASATNRNYFVHYRLVQEQATNLWSGKSDSDAMHNACPLYFDNVTTNYPSVTLRSSTFSALAGEYYLFFLNGGAQAGNFSMRDCEIYEAGSVFQINPLGTYTVQNNLISYFYGNLNGDLNQLCLTNNTFVGGSNTTVNIMGASVFNNAYDVPYGVEYYSTLVAAGNNAFLNGTPFYGGFSHNNDITTNLTWVSGPLGDYYQPTNSPLLNMGNTNANLLDLGDYTVLTNQIPEGSSLVSIGYHYFSPIATNMPPTVSLTNPTNGEIFPISPTNILLEATASDPDASVSKVEFFSGTNKLGEADSAPYQMVWTNVGFGTYSLSAKATDSLGLTGASSSISITVYAMPLVSIITPTNLQAFTEITNVTISASASSSNGAITSVQFYSGTNLLGSTNAAGTNSHYNFTWTNLSAGAYPVTAVATDVAGISAVSSIKVFRVMPSNAPPTVVITSPNDHQTFRPWPEITITANAYSSSGITNVSFYCDTNFLGADPTAFVSATTTNFEVTLHGVAPGNYLFTAIATDANGLSATSNPANITVLNEPDLSPWGQWDALFGDFPPSSEETYGFAPTRAAQFDSQGNLIVGSQNIVGSAISSIAIYSGCAWTTNIQLPVYNQFVAALLPEGTNVYVGGGGGIGDGNAHAQINLWNGLGLTIVGDGLQDPGDSACDYPTRAPVEAIHEMFGDLYIGGNFTGTATLTSGGVNTNIQYVARLIGNSTNWSAVGASGLNGEVDAIADLNNTLYIGGNFTSAGTNAAVQYIAKLVNGNWQPVASGVNGRVWTLTAHNGRLFVGGDFTMAGGTSANLIACWDGTNWGSINNGLGNGLIPTNEPCAPSDRVAAIAARGNEIYVTGHFGTAWNGATAVSAANVAWARWDQKSGSWLWTAMGSGLDSDDPAHPGIDPTLVEGYALAIHDLNSDGSYEVVVGGAFVNAGSAPSAGISRWIVGEPECRTVGPTVYFNYPFPYTALACAEGSFFFSAAVTTTGAATVTNVDFIVDNALIASIPPTDDSAVYEAFCDTLAAGPHVLQAIAYDNSGLSGASAVIPFTFFPSGGGPAASPDTYVVASSSSSTNIALNVLTNDVASSGTLQIVALMTNEYQNLFNFSGSRSFAGGTFSIGVGSTNLVYTAGPYSSGFDYATYSVADSTGTNSAIVLVIVQSQSQVQITQPVDGLNVVAPASLNITGASFDQDSTVNSVQLFVNSVPYGAPILPDVNSNFSLGWRTSTPGNYTFLAEATDNNNISSFSSPVTITVTTNSSIGNTTGSNPPIAVISSPTPPVGDIGGNLITNTLDITTGLITNATGSAYDPSGGTVSWEILLTDAANPFGAALYNLTPGPLDGSGFHDGAITNGAFGNLDLTTVQNGPYCLTLLVKGSGGVGIASIPISVDSRLKIGQFSFSEQDLILPVSGIPLTITRTYSSLNPNSADFGYGWTFAINSMDVALDEQREDVQIGSDSAPYGPGGGQAPIVSVRTGGGRDVTLTLPNGRRTTFVFNPVQGAYFDTAQWTPPLDVHATLTSFADPTIDFLTGIFWAAGGQNSTYDSYDTPGWVLQTRDGTQYFITRGQGQSVVYDATGEGDFVNVVAYGAPTLTSIVQRTGDTLKIATDGIFHYPTNSGVANRSVLFDRDGKGRITAIYDPNSVGDALPSVQYVYDQPSGNLIQVLKLLDRNAGTYSTNQYNYTNSQFPHYITSIQNADGTPVAINQYDESGWLIAVKDANGNTTQFVHNTTSRVEMVSDPLGNTNTCVYDLQGNVTAQTNALGQVTLMSYDAYNNKIQDVNVALGQTNNYGYTTSGFLIASTNALGYTNGMTYDDYGNLLTSIDARGNLVTNGYDPNTGSLLVTVNTYSTNRYAYDAYNQLISTTDALGNSTTNMYDGSGNITSVTTYDSNSVALSSTSYGYDDNGNRTNQIVKRTTSAGVVYDTTSYVYDAQNRLVQTIDQLNGTNTVAYNELGQQASTTDPLGRTTSYVYDVKGNLIQTIYPDSTTNSTAYDADNRRIYSTNQLGYVTQYVYDQLGRVVETIAPDSTTNSTIYDDGGRVQFTIDARGFTTAFGYDLANQQVTVTNAFGTSNPMVTQYSYDANGNRTNMVDALNHTNSYFYDALNRMTNTTFPDTSTQSLVYDADGRKSAQYDQLNRPTFFFYDGLGRLTAVSNILNQVTKYAYDEVGNQTNQTDALNRQTTYQYDALGRRTKRTLPGTQYETFIYDAVGNVLVHSNFNGLAITNTYDSMNRLSSRSNGTTRLEYYLYDAAGQLTNRIDSSGAYTWVFDSRGLVRTNTTPVGTLHYSYDADGNQTSLSSATSGGVNLIYQYDAFNRLTNVLDVNLGMSATNTTYAYDAVGNLQTMKYPNGVTNLWQYDSLNRLTNLVSKHNTNLLGSFYYQLGPTGIRTNLSETVNSTSRNFTWQYDSIYRLTNETISAAPMGSISYGYDAVGNRTNRSSGVTNIGPQTFTFNSNDWISTDGYDSNGNTTTNSSNQIYKYDYADRLTNFNGGAVTIVYDADGNRIQKVVGSSNTLYLVSAFNPTGYPQVVEEFTVSGSTNLTKVYTYGLNLISQRQGSTNYFFGMDGHGSTRFLTGANGSISNVFAYDAYGNIVASNTAPQTAYLFCGEQFDMDLGFYYLRARYLNPNTGRFWTMDSNEGTDREPLTLHRYIFVGNTPINGSDPTGLYYEIQSNFELGKLAEEPVIADFVLKRPWVVAQTSIHGILNYASTTGYKGVGRLIPDLADSVNYEIYDVKSWGETPAGMVKIQDYVVAFNEASGNPPSQLAWHAGMTYNYMGENPMQLPFKINNKPVYAVYFETIAGVIPYRLYVADDDEDRKRIPLPVLATEKNAERNLQRQVRDMVQTVPTGQLIYAQYTAGTLIRGAVIASIAALGCEFMSQLNQASYNDAQGAE